MNSANHLAGQLWEFVVLLEVWCVGNCSVSVASGRIGWRPEIRVIAWNSSISHEGIFNDQTCWQRSWGGGSLGMWLCDVFLSSYWFAFPLSHQSPARPPPTPACCLPALRWMGGVMIPTPPHICRHTWTVSQWAPRAPLPQVSRWSPKAAQRWPVELLWPGALPSLTVYLKNKLLACLVWWCG